MDKAVPKESLAEALPRVMARVRDEILPVYVALGPTGIFAVTWMRRDLDRAAKAMIDGDVAAMIECYESLNGATL